MGKLFRQWGYSVSIQIFTGSILRILRSRFHCYTHRDANCYANLCVNLCVNLYANLQ